MHLYSENWMVVIYIKTSNLKSVGEMVTKLFIVNRSVNINFIWLLSVYFFLLFFVVCT